MYPTQRMEQNIKLTRIVTDNHQIRIDGSVFPNAPQQSCLGDNAHMHLGGDTHRLQRSTPLFIILKYGSPAIGKEFHATPGDAVRFHVVESGFIEHVVLVACTQN